MHSGQTKKTSFNNTLSLTQIESALNIWIFLYFFALQFEKNKYQTDSSERYFISKQK